MIWYHIYTIWYCMVWYGTIIFCIIPVVRYELYAITGYDIILDVYGTYNILFDTCGTIWYDMIYHVVY